jgi:ABC-type transport system involved in cytochrome c biogenesis permease subunit
MENVLLRTRIAMLWIFMSLILLGLPKLNIDEQTAAGRLLQPTPGYLFLTTAASLVLFAMPFLCLTVKDSWNRWLNTILGVAFTVVGIAGTGLGLTQMTASDAYLSLMNGAATVAPAAIVYFAYRRSGE